MKLLIIQFSPVSWYLISPRFKHALKHSVKQLNLCSSAHIKLGDPV
jgi:hypothetical protein